jgi:hypothetical protein
MQCVSSIPSLPEELYRKVFNHLVTEDPLEIFSFTKETFIFGCYTKIEVKNLITYCLQKICKRKPLLQKKKCLRVSTNKNFLGILKLVEFLFEETFILQYIYNPETVVEDIKKLVFKNSKSKLEPVFDLEIIKWIHKRNPEIDFSGLREFAIVTKDIKLIEWLISECKEIQKQTWFTDSIFDQSIPMLLFLTERNKDFLLDRKEGFLSFAKIFEPRIYKKFDAWRKTLIQEQIKVTQHWL